MSESLSGYIKRQLELKGVTGKAAAEAIGVTPTYFGRVKKGKVKPSMEFCQRLAEFFNDSILTVMRLAGWLPDDELDKSLIERLRELAARDPGFKELLEAYASLESAESKELFLAMVKAAVEVAERRLPET